VTATPPTTTDTAGTVHATVSYPFANTVGCSCGWVRRYVHPDIHEDLITAHLHRVGL